MAPDQPWREAAALRDLLTDWDRRLRGRRVDRLEAGPGWLLLGLGGTGDPVWLCCVARPSAPLLWDDDAPPPAALRDALGRLPRGALPPHLRGARLAAADAPSAGEAIVRLTFASHDNTVHLLHQLFGGRGNLAVAAGDGRLLWTIHANPHPALATAAAAPAGAVPGAPCAPGTPPPAGVAAPEPAAAGPPSPAALRFRAAGQERLAAHVEAELAARAARSLRVAQESASRLRENLAGDLEQADRGDALRREAEALAAGLHAVTRGASEARVADPAGGGELTIPLDPTLSPAANMQEYFRRAGKADRGRALIASRLAAAEGRLAALNQAREDLVAIGTAPAAERIGGYLDWSRRHAGTLGRRTTGGPARRAGAAGAEAEIARPFRRYLIEDRWEVWVGRDNAENDDLTHRAAAPADVWLHAQGVAGSHVILRTAGRPQEVPRRVLEKAAALAALHSKGRHSALVPVLYTLRKYVRKPRHAPAGSALPTREKTLFVPPVVPEGAEPR